MQSMVKHHTVSFSFLTLSLYWNHSGARHWNERFLYKSWDKRRGTHRIRNYFVTAQQRCQSKRIVSLSIDRNNFTLHFRDESDAAVIIFILFPFLRYIGFNNMYWTIIYLWSNCLLIHLWSGIPIMYFMWFYLVH